MSTRDVPREMDQSEFGIFAQSEAMQELSQLKESSADDGLHLGRYCEGCSAAKECVVSWEELFIIQHQLKPQDVGRRMNPPRDDLFPTEWLYHPQFQCLYPNFHCGCEKTPLIMFKVTPDYARSKLRSASNNGTINNVSRQIIKAITPLVQAMSGQGAPPQQRPMGPAMGQPMMRRR